MMESLFLSTIVTALAEIGDKSQLLALTLAMRFKRPFPIISGLLLATILNHALAALIGTWINMVFDIKLTHWIVCIFLGTMILWMLIPQQKPTDKTIQVHRFGIFITTFVTFFIAESGDKSQLATVALAAHYSAPFLVLIGSTLGMLIINVPTIFLGEKLKFTFPRKLILFITMSCYLIMGLDLE